MLTHPTIALVEDDPTIAEIIAELLEQEDYIVQCYARSAHLLCRMSQSHPDIVLLDGTNPVCYDGWEAAARLQERGCLVVMFTAHHAAIKEAGISPRAAPFAGAIAKPCDIDDVLMTLNRIWQQHLHAVAAS
jgi:CheY-like chemotaxis protein